MYTNMYLAEEVHCEPLSPVDYAKSTQAQLSGWVEENNPALKKDPAT